MYFLYFVITSLEKGTGPSFEETLIPITQESFVQSWVEIGPVVLEKKAKIWKVYWQTDGQMNDGRQVIRKSSLVLSAQMS